MRLGTSQADASTDSTGWVAEISQFPLVPMRSPPRACKAHGVALTCLIVDDNPTFLEAASTLLDGRA